MAGTTYTYQIKFEGQGALAQADQFKKQLERRLGTITLKAKVDTNALSNSLKKSQANAASVAGSVTQRAMQQTIDRFTKYAQRTGAAGFVKEFEGSLAKALSAPSKQGVSAINALEEKMRDAQRATQRLGYTIDEYMGAGAWEKRFAAIQAAQRRLWGVRGLGYQLAGYGRQMMTAGAGGLGVSIAAMQQYVQFAGPLNRAARNLDLNVQLTNELDEALRSLAGTMSYYTPGEQAEVLYLWAAATGEVIDSEEELEGVLQRSLSIQKLMKLGAVDETMAVEAVTDVISQYGLNVDQTNHIVDTFITVAANSKAEVGDLGMAFSYAGTRAAAANTSFEDTAAVMELLAAAGLRGSRAGRGVSRLIENLVAPSNVAKKAMDELFMDAFGQGVEVMINAQGQFVGLVEAIKLLADATEEMTDAERANYVAITTTENASRALTPLLELEIKARERGISILDEFVAKAEGVETANRDLAQQMIEDIYGYTLNVQSATDTSAAFWGQYVQSTEGRMDRLKAAWSGAVTSIGASAAEALLPKLESLMGLVDRMVAKVEESPWVMEAIVQGGGILVAVGALVTALGKGLVLVADAKSLLMARTMKQNADKMVAAALSERDSATKQIEAAAMQQAAASAQLQAARVGIAGGAGAEVAGEIAGEAMGEVAGEAIGETLESAAAGAGGGAMFAGGGAGVKGIVGSYLGAGGAVGVAIAAAAPLIVAGLSTALLNELAKLTTGEGFGYIFGRKEDRETGRLTAKTALETMTMAEARERGYDIRKEINKLEDYLDYLEKTAFETVEIKMEGVPKEYFEKPGISPVTLIEKDISRLTAELAVYEDALNETIRTEFAWSDAHESFRLGQKALAGMTETERAAASASAALAQQVVAGKNAVADLAAALGLSEEAAQDWADRFFDGTQNIGLGMSTIAMAIQMMSAANQEIGQFDIAVAGGKAAQSAWGSLFAGAGEAGMGYSTVEANYQQYLAGLEAMLSQTQAMTAAELQWEVDAYNRSWQQKMDDAMEYYAAVASLTTRAADTGQDWMMQFAGVMDYSEALSASEDFVREQEAIIRRYRQEAEVAGGRIDFAALEYSLAANARKWDEWASDATGAMSRVESLKASALSTGWSAWESLGSIMGKPGGPTEAEILQGYSDYKDAWAQLMVEIDGLTAEQQALRIQQFFASNEEETNSYRDAVAERSRLDQEWISERESLMKQAEQGFRNLVSQALEPTMVTDLDMAATAAGRYVDKWDEYARRVRAAMAGSPDWDWMIPADIKAGGGEAINRWGQNMLDQFYAGMMPDAVNWSAFVDQFKSSLVQQAGKDRLVDRAIEELAKQGITATSAEVLSALGLESPFQQYFFGGLSADDQAAALQTQTSSIVSGIRISAEDVTGTAGSWATSLTTAMDTQLAEADLVSPIAKVWSAQVQEKGAPLTTVGEAIGARMWAGISGYMEGQSIVDTIVAIVLQSLINEIGGE